MEWDHGENLNPHDLHGFHKKKKMKAFDVILESMNTGSNSSFV